MTGFPDDDPRDFGERGDPSDPADPFDAADPRDLPDPLERLLHRPGEYLPAPPGAFERIRRRAARRRRTRALAGGAVVAALVTGSVVLAGALGPNGSGEVVGPPASSSRITPAPVTTAPTAQQPSPSPSRPTTPGSRTSPAPGSVPTPDPSRGSSPPTTGETTPQCAADRLAASLVDGDAGAGNVYRYLVVTNRGDTACHLTGFPGVSLLDADGQQIGDPATRDQVPYQPVVLRPGASASDTVHTVNRQGACLPTSTSLRVYPPGSRESLVVPGRVTVCGTTFTITPFAAGSTGNPSN